MGALLIPQILYFVSVLEPHRQYDPRVHFDQQQWTLVGVSWNLKVEPLFSDLPLCGWLPK